MNYFSTLKEKSRIPSWRGERDRVQILTARFYRKCFEIYFLNYDAPRARLRRAKLRQ